MPTVSLRGINCPDTVLFPQNEEKLITALRDNVPQPLHRQRIDNEIEGIVISIRHKLTVAMYQAALLCNLNANDFDYFQVMAHRNIIHQQPSKVEVRYKLSSYEMYNIHDYRLILTFLIETFSATAFSLFDVSGYLLNEMYQLGLTADDRISFHKVKGRLQNSSLYDFLAQYASGNTNSVPWIGILKQIRNRTTHRPIVEVCDISKQRSDIYAKPSQQTTEFLLNPKLFASNPQEIRYCDFVTDVFDGLEAFVEELYEKLSDALYISRGLPIS